MWDKTISGMRDVGYEIKPFLTHVHMRYGIKPFLQLTFHISYPRSQNPHPKSHISHLKFPILNFTSHIPYPTSHISHPTSHISHPTSHIPYPISHIPYPTSHILFAVASQVGFNHVGMPGHLIGRSGSNRLSELEDRNPGA